MRRTALKVTEADYVRLVFADDDRRLELYDGQLREKPGTTWEHGEVKSRLAFLLMDRLDRAEYHVFPSARVRQLPATILVPDLMVVPDAYGEGLRGRPDVLAIFSQPLPLIVEIWTAIDYYDVDAKLPVYQQRGDLEIWRIHPYERSIIAWRRQPDGSYDETVYREGAITLMALPGVTIRLDDLFDFDD